MAEKELKIKVKAEPSELTKLNTALREAGNEFLKLKSSGTASGEAIKQAGEKFKQAQLNLRGAKDALKEVGAGAKVSGFQLLELGENLTVVAAGISAVVSKVIPFISQLVNMGAELDVLKSTFKGTAQDLENFRTATAGTVTDANLIKLSNQAGDLGLNMRQQTILFSLAEDAADKYGGTVEENFQKVVFATEGSTKGLKQLGIQKVEYDKLIKAEVKSLGDELGVRNLTLDALDAETQKRIQTEAIIKLTGGTLESATNKLKDNKDKIDALQIAMANFIAITGRGIVSGIAGDFDKLSKSIKDTGINLKPLESAAKEKFLEKLGEGAVKILLPFTNLPSVLANAIDALNNLKAPINSILGTLSQIAPTVLLDTIAAAAAFAKNELIALAKLLNLIGANKGEDIGGAISPQDKTGLERAELFNRPTVDPKKDKKKGEKETLSLLQEQFKKLGELRKQYELNADSLLAQKEIQEEIFKILTRIAALQGTLQFDKLVGKQFIESFEGIKRIDLRPLHEQLGQFLPRPEEQEHYLETLSAATDFAREIKSIMESGAELSIGILLKGMQAVLELAIKIAAIQGAAAIPGLGILSGILGFLGVFFDEGGFTGQGAKEQPAGVVHRGEFVFPAESVNRLGVPFLNSLAGIKGLPSNPYLTGGHVTGSMSPIINVVVESEVERTKAIRFYQNTFESYSQRKSKTTIPQ